jgi:hypothetical protein
MDPRDIVDQLQRISYGDDFATRSGELADRWSEAPDGFDAVEPIVCFMESHPSLTARAHSYTVWVVWRDDPRLVTLLVAS